MEIVSAGSSSSGNSYIIIAGPATIILDVGLPAKKIKGALEHLGCSPEDVGAVLITHEHTDHVKSVRAISRCCVNAGFFASRGTVSRAQNFCHVPDERIHLMSSGDSAVLECPGGDRSAGGPDEEGTAHEDGRGHTERKDRNQPSEERQRPRLQILQLQTGLQARQGIRQKPLAQP